MLHPDPDEHWMRVALAEARLGLGVTSPNPAVGSLLVAGSKLLAKGHHRSAGEPHAEIECLTNYGGVIPKHAVLYVTLEPCSTTGRTGPCTSAIVAAGVRTVVIGATDPNPKHRGGGVALLRECGVDVRAGVLADECSALNEAFNKWIQTRRPFVIAKCGMTLDGRLTAAPAERRWLTSAAARAHSHVLRSQVDAILIGAATLRKDNPRLTARGVRARKQPVRVVLTRSGHLPRDRHLFTDAGSHRTLVFRDIAIEDVLGDLGEKEITSVLIEGGGEILGQALDARVIDKVQIYLAPVFTGGPTVAFAGAGAASTAQGARLEKVTYERIADDVCVIGYPVTDSGEPE